MKKVLRWSIIVIILAILAGGGYYWYQKKNATKGGGVRYITETAEKGNLISTVSGTGQILASNQVDIKPKVAGDLVVLNIKNGQEVKEGDLIAQMDTRDAVQKINEAKASLDIAKLDLDELLAPVDDYTLMQAENALADAQESLVKLKNSQEDEKKQTKETIEDAEDNLAEAYEDAYNEVADAFLDFPDIVTGLNTILYSQEISDDEASVSHGSNIDALWNSFQSIDSDEKWSFKTYSNKCESDYAKACDAYEINFDDYRDVSRYSDRQVIEDLLEQSVETARRISDTIKSATNMFDFWVEYRTEKDLRVFSRVTQYQSTLSSFTATANSHLTTLLTKERAIEDYKQDILDAKEDLQAMEQAHPLEITASERSIAEKEQRIKDLKEPADEIDIKNKKISIQQKENSLFQAQADYADHFIKAPFDGIAVEVNVNKGDSLSSGSTIATLVTNQKIAEVTLNEIDAVKIKAGQKTTLSFDAITDLAITGQVAEVDAVGTVSQGVVSYMVKIAFDVQDDRVKPGMSVSVSIITDSKQNVILVPISAVKTLGNSSYVERLMDGQPQRQNVTVGLSNDTMIEITSGLEEGDEIITQTLSNGNTTQTSGSSSQQRGGPDAMGGMFRIMR